MNAVRSVFDRLSTLALDTRAFRNTRVGAIGAATAVSLQERGIAADFVPDSFVSESAVESLDGKGFDNSRVLLPTADIARQTLADGLVSFGATVDTVVAYRTVEPEGSVERATRVLEEGIDIASFTSSSTVRNLVKLLDGDINLLDGVAIGCIGPITASTARELGLKVDIVARVHTIEGLLDALEEYFTEEDKSP